MFPRKAIGMKERGAPLFEEKQLAGPSEGRGLRQGAPNTGADHEVIPMPLLDFLDFQHVPLAPRECAMRNKP